MVTVKVIYKGSGKEADGKKVALYVDRFMASGVTGSEWTDSRGEAHFDVEPCNGEVYVSGATKYKGHLSGRIVVYI
jgi:hypothetical protein